MLQSHWKQVLAQTVIRITSIAENSSIVSDDPSIVSLNSVAIDQKPQLINIIFEKVEINLKRRYL